MPIGAPTFAEALRYGAETFHALQAILKRKGYATSVGDEGGFAPDLKSNEEACELIVEAIEAAGYAPGHDIAIALDPAASSFWNFEEGVYKLNKSGQGDKTSADMTALYQAWVSQYPIVSLEDGLMESDWDGFAAQTAALGDKVQIGGDDIYVTNPRFISRGIHEKTRTSPWQWAGDSLKLVRPAAVSASLNTTGCWKSRRSLARRRCSRVRFGDVADDFSTVV